MTQVADANLERLRRLEVLVAVESFERSLVTSGRVPDVRRLPMRWMRPVFVVIGAVLLALMVSVTAILLNFIIFNMVIHV
ncbi:MAG: hypothetical protein CMJ18_11460 [Phycisphaeraceae bacterium]|nr:hypothetical protein [Phycisphaeraceae bacterium]